jgi:hypothetical protein
MLNFRESVIQFHRKTKGIFTSTKFPDSLWGPAILLFNLAASSPQVGEAVGV